MDLAPYGFEIFWNTSYGHFVASCPDFPDITGVGSTHEEALARAKAALCCFAEKLTTGHEPLPAATTL